VKKLIESIFIFLLLLCSLQSSQAQVPENSQLFVDIMTMDSQLFDEGFNQCKQTVFEQRIDANLEFFHDKGGIQNRKEFLAAVKRNICSSQHEKPLRTLVPGSTQIFPLENNGVLYGAIQHGEHRFHTQGKDPAVSGYTLAKFTHVWLLQDGKWKLKTSLSYDHQQKSGKAATIIPVGKTVKPIKLLELSIASFSWSLYFRNLKN